MTTLLVTLALGPILGTPTLDTRRPVDDDYAVEHILEIEDDRAEHPGERRHVIVLVGRDGEELIDLPIIDADSGGTTWPR